MTTQIGTETLEIRHWMALMMTTEFPPIDPWKESVLNMSYVREGVPGMRQMMPRKPELSESDLEQLRAQHQSFHRYLKTNEVPFDPNLVKVPMEKAKPTKWSMRLTNAMKNTSNDWHQEVIEREFHDKPQGKWIIQGWYEDEQAAFYIAEAAWEKKQAAVTKCYDQDLLKLEPDGTHTLTLFDDYFRWNVSTPHWHLNNDGVWRKSLCGDRFEMTGEYPSKKLADKMLSNSKPPDRFENYQDHLNNAAPPMTGEEIRKACRLD